MTAAVLTPPETDDWTLLGLRSAVKPIVDEAVAGGSSRLVVDARACAHPDAFLGAVLARLMAVERLDVEIAYVAAAPTAATRRLSLPIGAAALALAESGRADELPLIRDDAASVLVGRARHVGEGGGKLIGEGYLDSRRLFDGEVAAVEIEPSGDGVRARVSRRGVPRRWVLGRAAQTGGPAVFVEREGILTPRPTPRSTFYPHHVGWRLVR